MTRRTTKSSIPTRHRRPLVWATALLLGALSALWPSSADAGSMSFSWTANPESDLAGYKLYYDIDSGPPYLGSEANEGPSPIWLPLASLADPNNPATTITGLPSCEHFHFALTAYDTDGNESDYTPEVDGTVLVNVDPVTATAAGAGALSLQWQAPPGDDQGIIPLYRIHYDSDPGEPYSGYGSPVDVPRSMLSDPDNPAFLLTGLADATTYYLVVESECSDGTSEMSDEEVGTTSGLGTGGTGGTSIPGSGGAGASDDDGSGGTSPGNNTPGTGGAETNIPWGGGGGNDADDPRANDEAEPDADAGGLACGVAGAGPSPRSAALLGLLLLGALGRRRTRRTA